MASEYVEQWELYVLLVGAYLVATTLANWQYRAMLNIFTPANPVILVLGIPKRSVPMLTIMCKNVYSSPIYHHPRLE